jgi:asparagine synthase (glutamine-hydrolysing)
MLPELKEFSREFFNVLLGHRRLSILDLSKKGHQPMGTADNRFWIVFNGEIYNYIELRRDLEAAGCGFESRTDTEVLLVAFQHWGMSALRRLIGMYAFAIYDTLKRELLLARDVLGIKPLYYAFFKDGLAFASEIKALLELPGVLRRPQAEQLYQYLRFGLTDGSRDTIYEGIYELPPAHYVLFRTEQLSSIQPTQYWKIDLEHRSGLSEQEASKMVKQLLEHSVRIHLRSDVPVGSCLSGGLDSTAIVMMMTQFLSKNQDLHSFSFIANNEALSEERFVSIAQKAAHTISHEVRPDARDFADDMQDLMATQELPFAGPSIYAQYRVFRAAKEQGIKVMLDGQGSDEIFAGYYNYIGARISGLIAGGQLWRAIGVLKGAPQNMRDHNLRMLLVAGGRLLPEQLVAPLRHLAGEPLWPKWLSKKWFQERSVVARERPHGRGQSALHEELLISLGRGSLTQLLRYEDRNSMRFSIESRVPFCIPEMPQLAYSLPDEYLVSDQGVTKAILKSAMRGIVPEAIIQREKVGFGTPDREWLSAILPDIERVLRDALSTNIPFFNGPREEIVAAIRSEGRWPTHVWRIFNAIVWLRHFDMEVDS